MGSFSLSDQSLPGPAQELVLQGPTGSFVALHSRQKAPLVFPLQVQKPHLLCSKSAKRIPKQSRKGKAQKMP